MPRTARPVLLNLDLGPDDGTPATARLASAIVTRISDGTLTDGDPLPSSRSLATECSLPRSAVVSAYEELISAGYLAAIGGSGTSVAAGASAAARAGVGTHVAHSPVETMTVGLPREPIPFDLRPGLADPSLVDVAEWRRAWRLAASAPIDPDVPWLADHRRTQRAVATYLRSARGVRTGAESVVLAPSTISIFRALGGAVRPEAIVTENPVYRPAVDALAEGGTRIVPLDVDADGVRPERLPALRSLLYVTPAHQFPLGHRLSVERRAALVMWARRTGSIIVEDDYDGEFRYDVAPLPALQSLEHGPDVVAYVGTASKIVAPSVQAAWCAAPSALADRLRARLEDHRAGLAPMVASVLHTLLDSGSLARTTTRAGRVYRARRTALLDALHAAMPWCRVVGLDAGLHLVLMLPPFANDVALAEQLERSGLPCRPLSPYYLTDARPGLVLGYTRLNERDAPQAARILADAIGKL